MNMKDEYQQVAALTCLDIDLLARVAENGKWSEKDLKNMIFQLKKKKDALISDAEVRETRYNAVGNILNLATKKGAS